MKVETINGIKVLTADKGKCLVKKGEEQNNDITMLYLAKSLTEKDFEEKDIVLEENASEE